MSFVYTLSIYGRLLFVITYVEWIANCLMPQELTDIRHGSQRINKHGIEELRVTFILQLASVQAINMFVSCLTLVLIAMDRVLLTLCPVKWSVRLIVYILQLKALRSNSLPVRRKFVLQGMRHIRRLAATAPVICYCIVWLLSLFVAAPYFFAVSAEDVHMFEPWNQPHIGTMLAVCGRHRPQICLEKTWHRLPFSRRTYTLTVLAIQYLLPLAALAFGYSQIGSTIRRQMEGTYIPLLNKISLKMFIFRKALLLLLLLVLIYAVAWFPMNAYNVLNVLDVIEFSQYRYIFCHLVGMTSACMNPIMYGLLNDSFRSAFVS
uniref:G-protein coupled receptors family 1 profile domain-containing protein n=1 Tax=Parascaris equorum TaxID=6256 RepID=A0A914RHY7_PAREQ